MARLPFRLTGLQRASPCARLRKPQLNSSRRPCRRITAGGRRASVAALTPRNIHTIGVVFPSAAVKSRSTYGECSRKSLLISAVAEASPHSAPFKSIPPPAPPEQNASAPAAAFAVFAGTLGDAAD